MSSNLIDLNSRRLRGQTPLDVISQPYFGFMPDDGRVFPRRNSRYPLNRRFSNGQWQQSSIPRHTPVDTMQRENYNYRYNNPFAVNNSQTYENPNYKARYNDADYTFPQEDPGPGRGDGFNIRQAVYGKPYGGFNPPGAGVNRISGRSIADDQDVETYATLTPDSTGYNSFGFPQKKKKRPIIEGYQSSGMMQSPYQKLPETFSGLRHNTGSTVSRQSRLWDQAAAMQPETFSPKTNKEDKIVLLHLLILTFILLILTLPNVMSVGVPSSRSSTAPVDKNMSSIP